MASKKSYGSYNNNQLILATEHSDGKPPRHRSSAGFQQQKTQGSVKLGSEGANTMDFIDRMLSGDNTEQVNLEEFKIPEYEGIQTSLMKNSASKGFGGSQVSISALNSKQDKRLEGLEQFSSSPYLA